VDAGQEGAGKLLKLKKIPTALLGMNDMVSAGLLQGLLAAGLRVPEDISLLGFDDTFVTGITTPKLTSVGYDYQSYGAELVQTALEPETEWPQDRRIPVFVAERASCAPPSKK
jgi:DNA-binding LacI/PurR family transcriptional regulator